MNRKENVRLLRDLAEKLRASGEISAAFIVEVAAYGVELECVGDLADAIRPVALEVSKKHQERIKIELETIGKCIDIAKHVLEKNGEIDEKEWPQSFD